MLLVTAATKNELDPVVSRCASSDACRFLVTGVGPMETAVVLGRALQERAAGSIEAVIHCGVAGAFPGCGITLLDICLAEREILADFGVCRPDTVTPFEQFPPPQFEMDCTLLERAASILKQQHLSFHRGTFLTVNSISGTAARGRNLCDRFGGMCENMEGAAVARVCDEYGLPCLELRCISNFVEDRNLENWRLSEAILRGGQVAADLILSLSGASLS